VNTRDLLIRRLGWSIFILACAVRVAAGLFRGRLFHPVTFEYDDMARSLVAGQGLSFPHLNVIYHSFAPPLYPVISALSYWIFGTLTPLMLLQVLAGGALAVVSAAIARRLCPGSIAPLAAGLLIAFHPGLIVYNVSKAHPLTFDALFFTLAMLQAFRLRERTNARRAIELGIIVGTGALSRATLIIFLPLAALWLIWVLRDHTLKSILRPIVIAGLCAGTIVVPWTIRSTLLHHRFVFMITTDAEDFWRGNNPNATGVTYASNEKTELEVLPQADLVGLTSQPNELAQADWFSARSRAFIREHPGTFVKLTVLKMFYFWWRAPLTGIEYPNSWLIGYMIYYLVIIVTAAIGLFSLWRSGKTARQQLLLIVAFLFALSLLQSLYYVEGRHRWAVEPILIAASGAGVATITSRRRRTIQAS
jgi:4-amino-4-deoxy-L-arabinose transferase-like glycosyltransferase